MTPGKPEILVYSSLSSELNQWGGSEKFWFEYATDAEFLSRFGCRVLLRSELASHPAVQQLQQSGVNVEFNGVDRYGLVYKVRRNLGLEENRFLQLVKERPPDLVWFNLPGIGDLRAVQQHAKWCSASSIPYWIILQHAWEDFFFSTDEDTDEVEKTIAGAARIVFISQRNRQTLERAIGKRFDHALMTCNTVRDEFFNEAKKCSEQAPVKSSGTARFLNLARFDPNYKGQHLLLEVLASETWRGREWHLTMVGGGHLKQLLNRLVGFYGLDASRVSLEDFEANVLKSIQKSDLLVLPSLSEGTPFSLIESMACARPAVGTPVGGIPELVINDETGWLARSTTKEDIDSALERAWIDRDKWADFGMQAQSLVQEKYVSSKCSAEFLKALAQDVRRLSS